jgi:hypothetical protein
VDPVEGVQLRATGFPGVVAGGGGGVPVTVMFHFPPTCALGVSPGPAAIIKITVV